MPARQKNQRPLIPVNAPLYAEKERTLILRFLAGLTLDEMHYISGIREFAGEDLLQETYQKQLRFHKARLATLRHCARRACNRQRHLLEMGEDLLMGIIESWELPLKT